MRTHSHILHAIFFLIGTFLLGCSGGTSGSGLRTYQGRISTPQGQPISDVAIIIESTGDSTVTNSAGEFALESDAHGTEVRFILEAPEFTSQFAIRDILEANTRVTMEITVDPSTTISEVNNIQMKAWFAGLCDIYFENGDTLRQANHVPTGTTCSINVGVFGDGKPLARVPVALQVARCEPHSQWRDLTFVYTGDVEHRGYAEINFEYKDSEEFCRYRVIAPFDGKWPHPAFYPIDTFTEQKYFGQESVLSR